MLLEHRGRTASHPVELWTPAPGAPGVRAGDYTGLLGTAVLRYDDVPDQPPIQAFSPCHECAGCSTAANLTGAEYTG